MSTLEPASKRAKTDPMAEVRAAMREAERAEWVGDIYEIKYLKEQVEHLRCTEPVSKDHELALITQQLKAKAARDRQKAAGKTNSTETFTCSICMERLSLQYLHVNVPCGHGFCKTCIAKPCIPAGAPAAPGTQCFSCRRNVASVMQTYI